MQLVDSSQLLVLTKEEVCSLSENKISNTDAFLLFTKGIEINPEVLFSSRFAQTDFAHTEKSMFDYVVLEMLPHFYQEAYLKQIGEMSFCIKNIASYTLVSMNDRVVVMEGCATDLATGQSKTDFTIDAAIFQAYCRSLVLEASEALLIAEDDEWEDHIFSMDELEQFGMPAGGYCDKNFDVNGSLCNYNTGACRMNLSSNVTSSCSGNYSNCNSYVNPDPATCSANASACSHKIGIPSLCSSNTSACGQNYGTGGGCLANAGACASNNGGTSACAAKVGVCAANVTIGTACGANAGACAAKVGVGTACGAKVGACGTDVGAGSVCGGNATSCVAKIKPGSVCSAKAGVCVVDIADACAANAVACVVNVPGDIVGACVINIIPLLPSC